MPSPNNERKASISRGFFRYQALFRNVDIQIDMDSWQATMPPHSFLHHLANTLLPAFVGDGDEVNARWHGSEVYRERVALGLRRGHALAKHVDDFGLLQSVARDGDDARGGIGMDGGKGFILGFLYAQQTGLPTNNGIVLDGAESKHVQVPVSLRGIPVSPQPSIVIVPTFIKPKSPVFIIIWVNKIPFMSPIFGVRNRIAIIYFAERKVVLDCSHIKAKRNRLYIIMHTQVRDTVEVQVKTHFLMCQVGMQVGVWIEVIE